MVKRQEPTIGAERYVAEHISAADAERVARKNGWDGNPESLLDHTDQAQATTRFESATFDAAVAWTRARMAAGLSLFGSAIIEAQIYEQAHDDRGNEVDGGSWESHGVRWEVDATGEVMELDEWA